MDLSLRHYLTTIKRNDLKKEKQLLFLNRLSRLLHKGYPLIESLNIIQWDKTLEKPAKTITIYLKEGKTLDEAFQLTHFSASITTYLYFIRSNGNILASIDKCLTMYEQRMTYTKKFQQVMRYPIILLIIFFILMYFIKQSVLPSFRSLFNASGGGTATMIQVSTMVMDYLSILLIVLVVSLLCIWIGWRYFRKKIPIEQRLAIYRRIPIFHKYKRMHVSFQFANHFSALLKTGMSIKEILSFMQAQTKLPILSYYAALMTNNLSQGKQLPSLLSELDLLEIQIAQIFQKNTDTYALENDLMVYAELLTETIQQQLYKVITYIQPIFFLIVAGFIVFIYISLMWPMFHLIKTI